MAGYIGRQVKRTDQVAVAVEQVERVVAQHDDLVEIVPGTLEDGFGRCPGVGEEALPQAAVVPVAAAGGQQGLVGGEGLQVVHPAGGALQSLAVVVAAYVVVEVGHGVQVECVGRVDGFLFFYSVARVFVEARGEQCERGYDKKIFSHGFSGVDEFRTRCSWRYCRSGRADSCACRRCPACCSPHSC